MSGRIFLCEKVVDSFLIKWDIENVPGCSFVLFELKFKICVVCSINFWKRYPDRDLIEYVGYVITHIKIITIEIYMIHIETVFISFRKPNRYFAKFDEEHFVT